MIPHGVPIVSVLFHEPDSENTKLVRIGEQISNLTSTDEEEPITGYLRGIQLCPHENNMNKGHIVYDNIPTYGYVNPDCAQAVVSVEDFDVEAILLQDQDGVYHKILMENVTSIEFQNDDQTAWIEATTEDIVNYVNSVSSDAIDVISVDASTKTINATVNTTSGLDIGLLDFLTGIEGIQSVTYKVNGQTFTMTVGDETTYDPFMEGVLSNMPTSETPNVNGAMTLNAENGAQLTYTLNVTYFNQVEEFGKIDTYLDSYTGEDVTVTKSTDKTYGVVGHIASAAELVFDVITAALSVKNVSDIALTAGEASANGVDAATLKAFINEKIPYSDLADPVAITMAVTAGDETVSYSFTFSSDYVVDPEAIIGDARYHTLAEALGAAKEGDTLVLQKNLTVNNAGIDGTAATPVIVIPVNMTFDGNNKTITADEASWVGTNTNHIIGVSNVTATIKKLNVVGHANTKSGIVCFGQSGNVTLENVDVQNCGNCGVQVAGATVSATSLTTSGNVWGGVNADKGSDGSTPALTIGDGCTFAEKAEVYTEIVDQNVVTAPSMTKVQGFGATLKGFIYYTTDVAKLECIATIGADKYCETVADAVANAVSGDEIKLLDNIIVDNTAVSSSVNTPVIIIPDGVTFNGGNFTITADTENWVGEGANHILGIVGTTGTIKDVTIEGNGKNKAGVIVHGLNSNGTLENITSKNNGQLGVLIGGATVVATNVNTEGNPWGGINVDKSSDGSIPNFTFNSGTLAENVEIYTEITDQDVITASGFEKVQGYGDVLKGFIFYTTDKSRLGSINGDGVVYETLADVVENTPNASVAMTTDLTEVVTVPVGANLTIDGGDHTLNGYIKCEAAGVSNTSLTLKDLTLNGGGSHGYAVISQNQTDSDQMECNLTLDNVTITGYTAKAIYGTNIKTLDITGGTISECATGSMNEPNTKGDYAVDLNLIAVQGTVVNIDGTVFTGDLGDKAAIKITQRGGASDAGASDIPKNVGEADIEMVTIKNCDFTGSTTEVDFRIGTDNKTGGDTVNTCGAFPVTIEDNNTEMVVQSAYLENEPTLTVPAGRGATKAADGDIAIVLTPEEQVDAIMGDIPGATETSNNVYSIVTSNGSLENLAFLDEIAAIPGFTAMTVSDGVAAPVTFEAGGNMETFKTQVQALLPDSNEDPQVTLTLTVSVA